MQVSGDGYEQLNEAIEGASYNYKPMSTLGELVPYYQETYKGRGQEGWRQHMLHDLSRITGKSEKYLGRRLDPSRLYKKDKEGKPIEGDIKEPGKKEVQAQYRELGKQLPMKKTPKDTTGKRARVTWSGTFYTYDSEKPRTRTFTTTLSPSQASAMRRGSFEPIFTAWGMPSGVITEIEVDKVDVDFL